MMRKILLGLGLLGVHVQLAVAAAAEPAAEAGLKQAGKAEVLLWEGVSALYHYAADPHSPFRAELAADYLGYVSEIERKLKLLQQIGRESDMRRLTEIELRWAKFKSVGSDIVQSGLEGVCCTSFQLSRLRETAEEVDEALDQVWDDLALVH